MNRNALRLLSVGMTSWLALGMAGAPRALAAACEFKTISLNSPGGPAQTFPNCLIGLKGYARSMDLWRYVAVSPNGGLLFTSNFGTSARGADAGSRAFYFFPVSQRPAVSQNSESKDVRVELASGQVLQLSGRDRRILALTRTQIRESAEVLGTNNGGIEIEPASGVMLDCGWRRGGHPIENSGGKCSVKTRSGASCVVPAPALRPLVEKAWESPEKLNQAVTGLLTRQCPGVDFKAEMAAIPVSGGDSPSVEADPAR